MKKILLNIFFLFPLLTFSSNLLVIKIFEENGNRFVPPLINGDGTNYYSIHLYRSYLDFINGKNSVMEKSVTEGESEVKLWNIPEGKYYLRVSGQCFDNKADLEQNILFYIKDNDVKEIKTTVKFFSYIYLENISDNPCRVVVSSGNTHQIMEMKGNSSEKFVFYEGNSDVKIEVEQLSGYAQETTRQILKFPFERCIIRKGRWKFPSNNPSK